MTTEGEMNTPAMNLAHEMAHANDASIGLLDNTKIENVKNSDFH